MYNELTDHDVFTKFIEYLFETKLCNTPNCHIRNKSVTIFGGLCYHEKVLDFLSTV